MPGPKYSWLCQRFTDFSTKSLPTSSEFNVLCCDQCWWQLRLFKNHSLKSGTGNLFIITVRINCGISLTARS